MSEYRATVEWQPQGEFKYETYVGGRHAHAKIKDLVRTVATGAADDAMIADTAKRIAEIRVSPEGREGIASFLEKRKPAWLKNFEAVRIKLPRKKK